MHALHECDAILYLSALHLIAPFTFIAKYYYVSLTKRTWTYSMNMLIIELLVFSFVIVWIYDRFHYTHWDEHNLFMESD